MKHHILTLIALGTLLATCPTLSAQEKHPGGWNFDVLGMEPKHIRSSKHQGIDIDMIGLSGWGFGLNAALSAPSGMNVEMGRSFHFFVSNLIGWKAKVSKKTSLSVGFGLDLKNFTLTGPLRFDALPTHQVVLSPYPDGAVGDNSRLRLFSTTYNLRLNQKLGKLFRLSLGPELYVVCPKGKRHQVRNLYTAADGSERKDVFKGIHTNKVGVNLVGMLSYKGRLGLYVKYTPTHYMSNYHGPEFQSLSTGIVVCGM